MDGDLDVDAEHAGQDRGGDLGGEGEQGGGSGLAGVQADVLQPHSETVVADGLAGTSAGKQPRCGVGTSYGGVTLAGGDDFPDEARQRLGENDRGGAQHDLDPVAVVVDVAGGEPGDAGDALCVEEQEQASDPVGGRQRAVVQEPPGVVPAFLAVVRAAGAFPADGAEGEVAGVPVGNRPADEVGGLVPVGGVLAGCPSIQVRLGAGCQGEILAGQPVQEVRSCGDVAAGVEGLQVGGMGAAQPLAESAQMVPDGVALQDPPLAGVCPGADGDGDPAFQLDQPLIAGGQRADGDQDAAQVSECLAGGELVEDLVGQPAVVAAEFSEKFADPGPGRVTPF